MQFLHYFSYVILGMVWPIYIGIFSLETRTTCHFLSGITIQFSSIFQLIIGTENKMGMFNRMRINRIHCWHLAMHRTTFNDIIIVKKINLDEM